MKNKYIGSSFDEFQKENDFIILKNNIINEIKPILDDLLKKHSHSGIDKSKTNITEKCGLNGCASYSIRKWVIFRNLTEISVCSFHFELLKTKKISDSCFYNDQSRDEILGQKERTTIHLSVKLIERIKNAVYWEPGLTVAGFCEQALLKSIDQLEKQNGKPYPHRKEELKGGRPIK